MAVTKGTARGTRTDRVVVPQHGTTTIAGSRGSITLRAQGDGGVRVEPELDAGFVLLRVDEPTELLDGDVLRAGGLWLSFRAGRGGRPGRLLLLDAQGRPRLGIALRGTALSLGREAGDVILPWDDLLAELHLQVLVRVDGTFVQDLATKTGTWVVARPGEVLGSNSVIAIDGRLLRVSTPPRRSRAIDLTGPTKVFVAA